MACAAPVGAAASERFADSVVDAHVGGSGGGVAATL
jgi:hypothetical protein